ncbi:hypothetical protein BBK82_46835 [Lentzea guizhouensis]|uniref:Uncharacterized protein n=1 Tax=Lentzea guizhouensis TaxID=1586287 RepID=A0A1B2HX84_9PSEU|nr:hypothetical protein [Lentzea guizhouensis]ANZ42326.1 hypothetical protein BBK82_46835 [Lentzea guizhouensis]
MALAERQGSFHRTVVEVVYRTMNQLAQTDSPQEIFELREQLRSALPWWRGLLRMHEPDERHRCKSCHTWYGRHRAWPCPVWRDAMAALHQLNDMYGFLASSGPVSGERRPGERVTVTARREPGRRD